MKVLVITDKSGRDKLGVMLKERLAELLEESKAEAVYYEVGKDDLKYCIGCFGCWLKTPGICISDDINTSINHEMVKNDLMILLSPIRYGCYSTTIKRVLDKCVPNALPFFKRVKGEIHHYSRYKKVAKLLALGYSEQASDEEIRTFKALAAANGVNVKGRGEYPCCCRNEEDVNRTIKYIGLYLSGRKDES